jgi:hypothetical protein
MPLLDLKTDLKSLKYGQDQPGGGSSGQPYIQTDINNPNPPLNQILRNPGVRKAIGEDAANAIGGFLSSVGKLDDGFVRGGIVGTVNASIIDTLRIGKFFTDIPKGPLFLAKQVGLQLSNPKLEVKKGTGAVASQLLNLQIGGALGTLTGGLLEPTRLYNLGINTLLQVPVNALGGHIVRHGVLPLPENGSKYEQVVAFNNYGDTISDVVNTTVDKLFGTKLSEQSNNRLVNLANELQLQSHGKPTLISTSTITKSIESSFTSTPTNSSNNTFTYKDVATGQIYKSSEIDFKDPNVVKRYKSGEIVDNGGTAETAGLLGAVRVTQTNILNKITSGNINRPSSVEPSIGLGLNIPSLSYIGGPDSAYGLGYTSIKRYSITSYNPNYQLFKDIAKSTTQNLTRLEVTDSDNDKSSVIADIGLSLLDSELSAFANPENGDVASIRDITAVNYSNSSPSLRKYKELLTAVHKTKNNSKFNLVNKKNLHDSNLANQTLTKDGQIPFRLLPSTNYSTDDLPEDITYYNGIQNPDLSYQKVNLKGFNNWNSVAREQRIGDFGEADVRYISYVNGAKTFNTKKVGRADAINLTPVFSEGSYFGSDSISVNGVSYNTRDLVKFRIQSVNTDSPDKGDWMIFRALLTSFSDNVDSQWTDINYAGRGNKFYVYNGFNRKISLAFKVAALSMEEMQPMYSKLNYLMSSLMPDYKNNIMRGPLHRLTVGNYLDSQFGKIDSVSYTIPNESPWEIALDEPEGGVKTLILPHIIEVQMSFTPIGVETAGRNLIEEKSPSISLLAQNSTGGDKNTTQYYSSFYYEK